MPALGAYTGGLDVGDVAYNELIATEKATAWLLGDNRLYEIPAKKF